jgi:signal transduction histidine kinase/ActR/RegA family two-component response regulator
MAKSLRDFPIGRKLVLGGILASTLALLVSTGVFLTSTLTSLRYAVIRQFEIQADMVADNASAPVAFGDLPSTIEVLDALHVTRAVDFACVYKKTGELLVSYPTEIATCPPAPAGAFSRVAGDRYVVARPISYRNEHFGMLFLSGNFSQVESQVGDQVVAALTAIVVGMIAAVVVSSRLQRVIARPIRELAATADAIAAGGDYSLRASRAGRDEVGHLVDNFNTMVAEVERREEQLRGANRLKDEFLAALSHELRTPLNAVLGWIQVLRTTKIDPATTAKAFESIERNARAQVTMIEDLLDISRIITGKLHFRSEPVDLAAVLDAALEVVRPAAEAKGITLERQFPPGPQMVVGDADRLQQIAWNLFSNAVKFTPRGGRVTVSLRADAQQYVFEVADTGLGIAPEFLPFVFDRFRQADGSLSRRHGGLGLGLAIARELAELHGGQISASSGGAGRGAVFTVSIPRPAATPAAASAVPTSPAPSLRGLTLLVVDDDEEARVLATAVIQSAGGVAEVVASAAEAAAKLQHRRYDAIVCDLAMPDVDGYELLRRVRADADAAIRATPAIAVSAHVGADAAARAAASGFQGFVAKPYDLAALVAAINQTRRRP